ncbi:hypothetical protein FDECE_9034 [Fusarium decemcellulare]|nr:hypothetical protein FDECE_9034 [Fusarium decemcellulare]
MGRKRRNEPGGSPRPKLRRKRGDTAYAPLDNTAPGSPETAPITKTTAAAQDEQRLRAPPATGQPAISVVLESSHGLTSDDPIILDGDDDANDRSANINLDTERVLPSGTGTFQPCNEISTSKPSTAIKSQEGSAIRHSSRRIRANSEQHRVRATAKQYRTNVGAHRLAALAVHSDLPPPQGDTAELEDLADMENDFHIMQFTREVEWKRNLTVMIKKDVEILNDKETENKTRIDKWRSGITEREEEIEKLKAEIAECNVLIDRSKEENEQLKKQREDGVTAIADYRKTIKRLELTIAGFRGNRNSTATVERGEEDVATAICGPRTTKPGIMNSPQDTNQQLAGRHRHRESPVTEPKPSTVSQPDLPPSYASTVSRGYFRLTHNTVHESAKELLYKLLEKSGYGKCGCKVTCGDDCSNKSGMIACDSNTCGVPAGKCENRKTTEGEPLLKTTWTEDYGYGLVTTEDIKEGDHVGTYLGQIISADEYEKRKDRLLEEACRQGGGTEVSFYVMELLPNEIYLDATREGNIVRYANHSCDPNTSAFRWVKGNGQPEMRLRANRNIRKGEEITFHYKNAPFQKIIDVTSTGFTIEKGCRCHQPGCLRKVYPCTPLILRAEAYQLLRRNHNASSRQKSELDKHLLLNLAESSLSLYADGRRVAQSAQDSSLKSLIGSKSLVIPVILGRLRQAIATNDHDRIKGGMYTLFFTSLLRTLVKDWRSAPEAMRLYIEAATAGIDKPSIQNLGSSALYTLIDFSKPGERMIIADDTLVNMIKPAGDVSATIEPITILSFSGHESRNYLLENEVGDRNQIQVAVEKGDIDFTHNFLESFKQLGNAAYMADADHTGWLVWEKRFTAYRAKPLRFDSYAEVDSALRDQLGRILNIKWLSQHFDYLKQKPQGASIDCFRVIPTGHGIEFCRQGIIQSAAARVYCRPWHFRHEKPILDDFLAHIDHPYEAARGAIDRVLSVVYKARYHESFENVSKLLEENKATSSIGIRPYKPTEEFTATIKDVFGRLEKWRHERTPGQQIPSSYTSDSKTVLMWLLCTLSSHECIQMVPFFPAPFMEELLYMMDIKEGPELMMLIHNVYLQLPNIPFRHGEDADFIDALIRIGNTSTSWHQRLRALVNMQVIYFGRIFLTRSAQREAHFTAVSDMLGDPQLEVLSCVSTTLASMIRCSP